MGRSQIKKPFRHKDAARPAKKGEVFNQPAFLCEAEVVDGLAAYAREEITNKLGSHVRIIASEPQSSDSVLFRYSGDLRHLLQLNTVQSVYLVRNYDVPRPRGLLGNEHFQNLQRDIAAVITLLPADSFKTFYISAAGSDSSVMVRLKQELSQATGLADGESEGDLLLRIRRGKNGSGWQSLVRLTPRPLAARFWRVCNFPGALNASVAHVMALLTNPRPDDIFLNIACGSGTLMIERLMAAAADTVIGCDNSFDALECAKTNLMASERLDRVQLLCSDAGHLPLGESCVSAICADLPFGNLVGSHEMNLSFYPALLNEAARVSRRGTRFALITHEIRLMQNLLQQQVDWHLEMTLPITLTGLHPRIYVLVRK